MKIKNLFDDLKQLGRKEYYFRNGEEEIYFFNHELQIEIISTNNNIDLIINSGETRDNYRKSKSIPENCKKEISRIIDSFLITADKCKKISQILLEIFDN